MRKTYNVINPKGRVVQIAISGEAEKRAYVVKGFKIKDEFVSSTLPKNVNILLGAKIEEITNNSAVYTTNEKNKTKINSDIVIMAAGVRPNSKLASEAKLKLDRGFIAVNNKMQTSDKCIYAVGDCIVSFSIINNKPQVMQLVTPAFKQGAIAGINAAGGNSKYKGIVGTFVTVTAGIEVAATGFTESYAQSQGYNPIATKKTLAILFKVFSLIRCEILSPK